MTFPVVCRKQYKDFIFINAHFLRFNFKLLTRKYVDKEARPTLVLWVLIFFFVDEKASAASLDLSESNIWNFESSRVLWDLARIFRESVWIPCNLKSCVLSIGVSHLAIPEGQLECPRKKKFNSSLLSSRFEMTQALGYSSFYRLELFLITGRDYDPRAVDLSVWSTRA